MGVKGKLRMRSIRGERFDAAARNGARGTGGAGIGRGSASLHTFFSPLKESMQDARNKKAPPFGGALMFAVKRLSE